MKPIYLVVTVGLSLSMGIAIGSWLSERNASAVETWQKKNEAVERIDVAVTALRILEHYGSNAARHDLEIQLAVGLHELGAVLDTLPRAAWPPDAPIVLAKVREYRKQYGGGTGDPEMDKAADKVLEGK